ncbi:MAG: glycosyl hydrolase [Oscillospiraceae bacterium]|nr:glycosyl hydrolase [Oscillospiraceae bacterium]
MKRVLAFLLAMLMITLVGCQNAQLGNDVTQPEVTTTEPTLGEETTVTTTEATTAPTTATDETTTEAVTTTEETTTEATTTTQATTTAVTTTTQATTTTVTTTEATTTTQATTTTKATTTEDISLEDLEITEFNPVSTGSNLRRVVSSEQPMWIVHIDTWNYADPQKIIDLIPEDIKPYVVFNISLSIGGYAQGKFERVGDGYETAKSWLRVCAENQVWALVQPASGGYCHYEDLDPGYDSYENTLYTEFFEEYPNFLGFNYCEQFWGFEWDGAPSAVQRWTHFAGLLEVANKYGGYLVVSWCGNQWSPSINPLAMLRRVKVFREACSKYSENFILCEKYTQQSYINDMESLVFGYYLSGYAGNVGVRYDETGWTDGDGSDDKSEYTVSTGLAVQLERLFLNGYTVIDGPELIWADDFYETWGGKTDSEGYKSRTWDTYDQFDNVAIDMFRKVIEGDLRIPTREEVIKRTKVAVMQDNTAGSDDARYSTYSTLFKGLYQQEDDGALRDNYTFYKSTGRYPTVPTIYGLNDKLAEELTVLKHTELNRRWNNSVDEKVEEFNSLFKKEYSGDLYAGRYENTWVIYNPYKAEKSAAAKIPLQYNTCESVTIQMPRYSSGTMTEYSDKIEFYLNNYDENNPSKLRTDIIKITGAKSEPKVSYKNRGTNTAKPTVSTSWEDGVLLINVKHNGPVDLTVECEGTQTNRKTEYTKVKLTEPKAPEVYTGELQYEGECFDYKNAEVVKNGYNTGVEGYTGQGYIKLKKQSGVAVKDIATIIKSGEYKLVIRYVSDADVDDYVLYINGTKIGSIPLDKTSNMSSWKKVAITVDLKGGENKIELKSNGSASANVYIDNITVAKK